jgi:uncharacterized membrane protein YtjA (UPF0391 family)
MAIRRLPVSLTPELPRFVIFAAGTSAAARFRKPSLVWRRRRSRSHRTGTLIASPIGAAHAASRVHPKEPIMLHYAVVFLVIALIAALFGFGGIAVGAVEIAKVLFFIFLLLFVVSLIVGLFRRGA